MSERVKCEICLEECQKDDLKEHQEICMAQLMFRCAICDGDYMSKEGLWNHLDLHEIADGSKELHCQEIRATYKLHQCTLCNDHRWYQEDLYWKHVHDVHDDFFLRCSGSSENFISLKLKTDHHDLAHCNAREQTVGMSENASLKLESSQEDLSNIPRQDIKCFAINIADQPGTLVPEQINEDYGIDSRLSEFSPAYLNNTGDTDNTMTEKESKSFGKAQIYPKGCSQEQETSDSEESLTNCNRKREDTPPFAEDSSSASSDTILFSGRDSARYHEKTQHLEPRYKCANCPMTYYQKSHYQAHFTICGKMRLKCKLCGQMLKHSVSIKNHMKRVHHIEGDVSKFIICFMNGKKQRKQKKAMQIAPEEKISLLQHVNRGKSTPNSSTITDSHDLSKHGEIQKVVQCKLSAVNYSGESSALTQEKKTGTYKDIDSANAFTSSDRENEDSRLIEHSSANPHDASETNTVTEMKAKLHPTTNMNGISETKAKPGKTLQPFVENLLSGSSDTKCAPSSNECSSSGLNHHIEMIQMQHACNICGITFPNYMKACYHKLTKHTEAKHKCPNCWKKFYNEKRYLTHLSSCAQRKFSCEFCDQKFKASAYVVRHMRLVHKIKGGLKKILTDRKGCQVEHKQHQADEVTVKKEISAEEITSDPFVIIDCPICGENFGDQNQVSRHVEEIHQMIMCASCRMTFTSVDQLNDHKFTCPQHLNYVDSQLSLEKISQPHSQTSSSGLFGTVCSHCDKDCCHEALLARHIAWCHQPVVCATCGDTVSSKSRMKYHKMKNHSEPKFKCAQCRKTFHLKNDYLRHMPNHENVSKLPCKLCDLKFKNVYAVNYHMKQTHNLKKKQTNRIDCNELEQELQPCGNVNSLDGENMEIKMEIQVEETTLQEQEYQAPDENRGKSPTVTIINASQRKTRKLTSPQHLNYVDSQLSSEKILQPYGETSSSGLFDTVCPHCDKDCCHEALLARHIAWYHQPVVCATCGDTVSSKSRMKYHKMKNHSEPKFKCPHCSKKFHLKNDYLRHMPNHENVSKLPCKLCDLKFKNVYAVTYHMRQMHNLKGHQTDRTDCNELEQELQPCGNVNLLDGENMEIKMEIQVEETTLQEQEYQAPDENCGKSPTVTIINASQRKTRKIKRRLKPKFSCKKCYQTFHELRSFQAHVNEHKKNDRNEEADYQMKACSICGATFGNKRKLEYHKQVYHADRKYKCSLCPLTFHFGSTLRRHEKRHKKTTCKLCSQYFEDDLGLESHLNSVHSYAQLICNKCDLKFTSHHELNNHMKRFHTEPRFKCPDCGKLYNIQHAFRNHMAAHSRANRKKIRKNKGISKQLVDAVLVQDPCSSLQNVKSEHLDHENEIDTKDECLVDEDRSEPCPICGSIFEHRAKMVYHKLVAHTEPQHKCSHCPKLFHLMSGLRRHEQSHSKILEAGGKAVCNLCPIRFPDESGLQRHIAKVHPSSAISCDKCDLKFTNRQKLCYHRKKIHTESSLKCPDCGKVYNFQYHLRRHMAAHLKTKQKSMKEVTETSEQRIDEDLEQNEDSFLQIVESKRLDHENEIEIKEDPSKVCSICGLFVIGNMQYHRRTAHIAPKHKCSHCPKMFCSISKRNRHEAAHSEIVQRNLECKLCSKTFRGEYSLQRHVKLAHPPSELPCDMCDLKFTTHPKLYYHMNSIHISRFKCLECDEPFLTQFALRKHMDVHSKAPKKKQDDSKHRS